MTGSDNAIRWRRPARSRGRGVDSGQRKQSGSEARYVRDAEPACSYLPVDGRCNHAPLSPGGVTISSTSA